MPSCSSHSGRRRWIFPDVLSASKASGSTSALSAFAVLIASVLASGADAEDFGAIAVYAFHDASVALSKNGRVQCVLELERLFEVRYFKSSLDSEARFHDDWLQALRIVRDRCECDGQCPRHLKYGVIAISDKYRNEYAVLRRVVEEVFVVDVWHSVNHHHAHSVMAFHASPFRSALVVSYDGGGNDGSFNVYIGLGHNLTLMKQLGYNMGKAYTFLSLLLPEVTGDSIDSMCYKFLNTSRHRNNAGIRKFPRWVNLGGMWDKTSGSSLLYEHHFQSYPGKLMGYAATGAIMPHISFKVRDFYWHGTWTLDIHREIVRTACRSVEDQRCLAASIQAEFQQAVLRAIQELFQEARASREEILEGLVLTGGCALNVLANQLIYDTLKASATPTDVYVPPAPHDGGLVVGAIWAIAPPAERQPLQYLGFRLWDEELLDGEARRRGAESLTALGGVEFLAELLAGRAPTKPIIAVVRGRQEYGPRALGHRSLLAVPDSEEMRVRMNRLKFRQWYRPVAPMIADEALEEVFGEEVRSPYMSMAPLVRDNVRARFPALAHLDGTARHQSVGKDDEPWVHALLLAFGRRTGLAALINTSFNTRGKPIVNTVQACLKMLDELPDLDYVLIEDWLFRKTPTKPHEM